MDPLPPSFSKTAAPTGGADCGWKNDSVSCTVTHICLPHQTETRRPPHPPAMESPPTASSKISKPQIVAPGTPPPNHQVIVVNSTEISKDSRSRRRSWPPLPSCGHGSDDRLPDGWESPTRGRRRDPKPLAPQLTRKPTEEFGCCRDFCGFCNSVLAG
jgi:hypothetical protein